MDIAVSNKPTPTYDNKTQIHELRKFVAPEIIFGEDARLLICRYLQHFTARKPMIVTDSNLLEQPWFTEILDHIISCCDDHYVFSEITSNPRDYETMLGAELFITQGCDVIIAIGGGSPMDCAKGIGIVASNGGNILDYEGVDSIRLPGPPLICLPTTSGTSADVSQFAIICDTISQAKKAIISKKVVPDLALIDPVPLMTMDQYLSACTGMDALTHAIEAYVSNAQSAMTDVHALEAIKLIAGHLRAAVNPDRTLADMSQMMMASLHAGLAFSNASLGAVHALAHSLGGLLDLPHGECNSILLEHIIDMNYDYAADRYDKIAEILSADNSDLTTAQETAATTSTTTDTPTDTPTAKDYLLTLIRQLRQDVGIKPYVKIDDISDKLLNQLAENALTDPCMVTNPRELSTDEIISVFKKIFKTDKQ